MKSVFIVEYRAGFSIKAICRVLRVARSGWYAWRKGRHQHGPVRSSGVSVTPLSIWPSLKQKSDMVRHASLLKRHNLRGSMSAKGCCYDDACVESFLHSMKVEYIHGERFASREIMSTTVFNYIECDYNRWRRHSACGGLSPEQLENANLI